MKYLDKLLKFVAFTHKSHKIERIARIPGTNRYANMVEHSWQLAMLAWYIIDTKELNLDKAKVLQYALAHDLVETYAGDTFFYDTEALSDKHDREHEAQTRIAEEQKHFPGLNETILSYELKKDDESRFVYALDKTIDPLNIYLEGGLLWKEKGVTIDMLLEKKQDKVKVSSPVKEIFDDLFERIKAKEVELFGKK